MAILLVREIPYGRSGSLDDKGDREYTRVFQVITDSPATGSIAVRQATGVPRRYDIYADSDGNLDTGSLCKSIEVQQQADPFEWKATIKYSSRLEDPEQGEEDPLDRPAEISWGSTKCNIAATMDRDGGPIRNSAGEPFDPPLEVEQIRLTLKIQRNETTAAVA